VSICDERSKRFCGNLLCGGSALSFALQHSDDEQQQVQHLQQAQALHVQAPLGAPWPTEAAADAGPGAQRGGQ
jgi:hypothetical protein